MNLYTEQSPVPHILYAQLMTLCSGSDAFYFKDFPSDSQDSMYRIFNYRLASYSDFLLPGALECRGTMFLVDRKGNYIDLVCRPPKKFFNLNENPLTMNLDLSRLSYVMVKEDGSLMSSYIHTDATLRLKSKGSTGSEQANDAMKYLNDHPKLLADIKMLAATDFTVNLEWVAPWNRIVVGYNKPGLVGISIIDNATGKVYGKELIEDMGLSTLADVWVDEFEWEGDLVEVIQNLTNSEGVVAVTESGVWFKLKGDWYLSLHRNKDSVSNTKSLIELVLMEKTDDLKSMFVGDSLIIDKINAYERHIGTIFNNTVSVVEAFHAQHQGLDRKSYALEAQDFYGTDWKFHIQMSVMLGRDYESQIKDLMIRNCKDYILKEYEKDFEES